MLKPILFSTPMVQAILDDRKSMTRRVIKRQLPENVIKLCEVDPLGYMAFQANDTFLGGWGNVKSPYAVGDILWVQETWRVENTYMAVGTYGFDVCYKSDGKIKPCIFSDIDRYTKLSKFEHKNGWQSPYFMPREAARIFLRVTNVRVERLQEITEDDARAEGVNGIPRSRELYPADDYIYPFKDLWDSLNWDRGYPWERNPWVWVYEFERVSEE